MTGTTGTDEHPMADEHPAADARSRLGAQLAGAGVELGPGAFPFRLLRPGVRVRYVDRWEPQQNEELFGEALGPQATFLEPDVVSDLNTDRLGALPDESEDFVIASHVLEHLAEPIGMLDDIHRVLRRGGLVLIFLPSRLRTEDRFRDPTPLEHLVDEHTRGVTDVEEPHLVEFLLDRGERVPRSGAARAHALDLARRRSIHVHCWEASEFVPVLRWTIENLGHRWELVDATRHDPPFHFEFGFLLRKAEAELDPSARSAQFQRAWTSWVQAHPDPAVGAAVVTGRSRLARRALQRARAAVRRYPAAAWLYRRVGGRHIP